MTRPFSARNLLMFVLLYAMTGFIIGSLFFLAPHERNDFPILRDFIIFFAAVLLTKYFVYMAASPWYEVVAAVKRRRRKPAASPRVSVVVPAWNEEVGLVQTVATILKSTYRNLEVVVVNDGSTDGSDARMRTFLEHYERLPAGGRIPVIYRFKQNGGKGRALNAGIELATGEIIVSIDADCALTPHTIGKFVECFEDENVAAAVGNVKIGNTSTILGMLQYLEFLFSFYFKRADSLFNTIYIIGGAAGAFRRSVFDRVGFYSGNNITEDIDLSVRIQKAGMRIVYAPEAVVYTEGAGTLEGLMAQRLRWKRGRFQTFWEHRSLFFSADPRHSKPLSWIVLPLAVFGDTQLFFELFFLAFLYLYSLLTHDFSSFISGIIVVSSMFAVQMYEDASTKRLTLFLLAPIGWLLFYITTLVEHRALAKSITGLFKKQKIGWQRWERTGCFGPSGRTIPYGA